ncbi:hypothetical protein [Streptomyces sp. DH12]|uniref:hypothetical protein n=1 Tax=Streptomyces sp. DH12 TaxID=2857010 RepID=UPI001E3FFA3F|nr:hypothetical protein [Streptomyces sp. DH12]
MSSESADDLPALRGQLDAVDAVLLESVPRLFRETGRWSSAESRATCNDGMLVAVRGPAPS